jgi:hypothetical protein
VHDAERVAAFDHANDRSDELRGGTLGVVALGDDAVEELAAGAELHDEVHEEGVLVGAADADDVGVLGEVVHDLDLAPHVLVVLPAQQLALGDGLARVLGAVGLAHALVRGAELPLPQLLPDAVVVAHVVRLVRQHRRRPAPGPNRHWRRQPHVRIGSASLLPARALRVRLHCLRLRWSLPGSRTVRASVPSLEKKCREARILTDGRSEMETDTILGLSQGKSIRIGTKQREDWILAPGTFALGILGGIVNDTGEIQELWERFMAPRRPKKRQGGRRRCEEMGLLGFSLPFPILMILAGIFMERSHAQVGCFRRVRVEITSAI